MSILPQDTVIKTPLPVNESDRLKALHRYDILDTPPEAAFDRITALAARLFNVPIALVSLVDESRAWFKSCHGFDSSEVQRDNTICSFAVLYNEMLVVPDARQDKRFACNPFVQSEPGLRFYAGAPLVTPDGFNLGTLCLLDTKPRPELSAAERSTLIDLAAMVVDELDLRLAARRIAHIDTALLEITQGVAVVTGQAFFHALVQHFTQVLDVDYTYIALLKDSHSETLKTIATCADGQIIDNFEYLLADTPCQKVLQQRKICCYPIGIQAQFPQAPLLAPLQIESYVAIPFFNSTRTPLGLLGIMDRKPLENVQLVESLLTIFALRIATELDRQQAEERHVQMLIREQKARQQAENANRIKDEFLAVLSHELRSPLNPILGWTKILRSRKLGEAKTHQALEIIERNAQLQAQLIEDLLDVSRILSGKLALNVAEVSLPMVVKAAIDTVKLAADAKEIEIRVQLPPVAAVMGDGARLQQVVWNLLSNAVKFTPKNGQITVNLRQVDDRAELQVIDTGKGIGAEFLPYVFAHFQQEDSSTTRKFGGLGLGLAIARQLVEMHGGTVKADSPGVGQGATFTVQFPLLKTTSSCHESPDLFAQKPHSSLPLAGLRVLVVDDEPDSRELIQFLVQQAGAEVIAVGSAIAALQTFPSAQPNLLLSDIGMPEMDGYGLMRQIRTLSREQGGQIPAIALTAYAGESDRQQALSAGFQRHLAKPIDPDELIRTVAKLAQ